MCFSRWYFRSARYEQLFRYLDRTTPHLLIFREASEACSRIFWKVQSKNDHNLFPSFPKRLWVPSFLLIAVVTVAMSKPKSKSSDPTWSQYRNYVAICSNERRTATYFSATFIRLKHLYERIHKSFHFHFCSQSIYFNKLLSPCTIK